MKCRFWTVDCGRRLGDDLVMIQSDIEVLDAAVLALNDRELEPFVGLMSDDMVWTGQAQRWFWWRQVPS